MAFDISTFRSQLQNDGARGNLFEVLMPFPGFAGAFAAAAPTKLQFLCHAASLPESTVASFPVMYFGREIKLYGNRTYADWNITVYNDEDFVVRNAFEGWLNAANSSQGNLRSVNARSPVSYGVDALVNQYAKTGEILKTYQFIGMFPTNVSPIDVAWANNDSIEEFSVTLAFQYWIDVTNGIV
jgi:hypothetical protein